MQRYENTWIEGNGEKGISGIVKNKKERPALEWLREYMQTDAAKNAKSPFPGMVKEASVYVKPESMKAHQGEPLPITVNARLKTKEIDHIDLYVNDALVCTMTEAPYETTYTPSKLSRHTIKAVVTATDGTTYERLSGFTASKSTSIQTINCDDTRSEIYTLQGVKVNSQWDALSRGVYIVNGKKMVKK